MIGGGRDVVCDNRCQHDQLHLAINSAALRAEMHGYALMAEISDDEFSVSSQNDLLLCSPCPWGEGTSRFTVVCFHLNVCWHPSAYVCVHPRLCQSLFTQYFLQFFANGFHILRYGDHRQDLEVINFS